MHVALAWKVGPQRSTTVFDLTISQVTLLLALLVDGTISTTLNLSATAKATFQVYTLPGCGEVGKNGQQTTIYHVPGTECVDTPPIPKVDDRFLSYTAKVNTGAAGSICFFDVFPYKNCTGSYSGFISGQVYSGTEYSSKCENVLQGFTGLTETYGAKSLRFSCWKLTP